MRLRSESDAADSANAALDLMSCWWELPGSLQRLRRENESKTHTHGRSRPRSILHFLPEEQLKPIAWQTPIPPRVPCQRLRQSRASLVCFISTAPLSPPSFSISYVLVLIMENKSRRSERGSGIKGARQDGVEWNVGMVGEKGALTGYRSACRARG